MNPPYQIRSDSEYTPSVRDLPSLVTPLDTALNERPTPRAR